MFAQIREMVAGAVYPEMREERRGLERMLDVDPLTGLGNRRAFDRATLNRLGNFVIVIFDMNNLGMANKVDGHKKGDWLIRGAGLCIKYVTHRISGTCRAFRLGGDEFAVLIEPRHADAVIDMVRRKFGRRLLSNNDYVSISGSYGVSYESADKYLQAQKFHDKALDKHSRGGSGNHLLMTAAG